MSVKSPTTSGRPHLSTPFAQGPDVRIILVRHAQPAWAPGGLATTVPDLSALGVEQAGLLPSNALFDRPITDIWVSPMPRAVQTAQPILEHLNHPGTTHDFLAEIGNPPHWEGKPEEYVEQAFIDLANRHPDDWWEGFGGESFRDFHRRVHTGFEAALADLGVRRSTVHPEIWDEDLPDRVLVIVAHQGTNALLLGLLLDLKIVPWEWERFACAHASVSLVGTARVGGGRAFSLRAFSDVSHLPRSMITR